MIIQDILAIAAQFILASIAALIVVRLYKGLESASRYRRGAQLKIPGQ